MLTETRRRYVQAAIYQAKRGEDLTHSKLTAGQVAEIRAAKVQRETMLETIRNNLGNAALAKRFGVHIRTIEKALSQETWRHIR